MAVDKDSLSRLTRPRIPPTADETKEVMLQRKKKLCRSFSNAASIRLTSATDSEKSKETN